MSFYDASPFTKKRLLFYDIKNENFVARQLSGWCGRVVIEVEFYYTLSASAWNGKGRVQTLDGWHRCPARAEENVLKERVIL
jgi:hypothetical protein